MDKEITINGIDYIAKSEIQQSKKAECLDGLEYKIIRTYSAGVHAGYLKDVSGDVVTLINSRRIWKWEGAASLSQLAQEGTSKSAECKFPCIITNELKLNQWIEIIDCTEKAKKSIQEVEVWEE